MSGIGKPMAYALGLILPFFLSAGAVRAQQEILLWPNGAPGATGTGPADKPSITPYPASKPNGAAVVCFPGGAYSFLATDLEATQPAKWLQSQGISAFVVKYRVSPYRYPIELWDGQRAIRWVRAHAKEYGIDTAHIGVMGFSAGGHMATMTSTHYDGGKPSAADSIDRHPSRPAFTVSHYGVITMDASFTHSGSRSSLLGPNPSQALVDSLSNEKQVDARTPPAFLTSGDADKTVNVKNTRVYFDSLMKHGVAKSAMMIFAGVDHSYGLADGKSGAPNNPAIHAWCDSSLRWMKAQGFLAYTVPSGLRGSAPAAGPIGSNNPAAPSGAGLLFTGPEGRTSDALGRRPETVNGPGRAASRP